MYFFVILHSKLKKKMQNRVLKYSIIFFLLLVYINRGLFVFAYEIENQGSGEINSVVEWLQQLVTGKSNDIDEDGDAQADWNFTQISLYDFPLQPTKLNLFSIEIKKIELPYKENFLLNDFYSQIDHPPKG